MNSKSKGSVNWVLIKADPVVPVVPLWRPCVRACVRACRFLGGEVFSIESTVCKKVVAIRQRQRLHNLGISGSGSGEDFEAGGCKAGRLELFV